MSDLQLSNIPVAKAAMLIRKPVAEVFQAFVDPEVTTKFWFTKGSGKLEPGKRVRWDWEMYNVFADVTVNAVETNKRILIEWSSPDEKPTTVEWVFTSRTDGTTFVSVTHSGFTGGADQVVGHALGSTEGFALVLAGAKALLEHDVRLNLVADHHPAGVDQS